MSPMLIRRFLRQSTNVQFDTAKFVQSLESEGFTRVQAEAVMRAFSTVVEDSLDALRSTMVTKGDHEKNVQMYKVDFTSLRSEFKMQEKTELTLLKSQTEQLAVDIERAKQKIREELAKLQSSVRLDMSLERGRIRDESIIQEAKIREADAKIETEMANIKAALEGVKFDIVRNIVGVTTAAAGLILAYLRFLH